MPPRASLPTQASHAQLRNLSTTLARPGQGNPPRGPASARTTTPTTTAPRATAVLEKAPFGGVFRPASPNATRSRAAGKENIVDYMKSVTTKQAEDAKTDRKLQLARTRIAKEANTQANERSRVEAQQTARELSDELMSLMGLRLRHGDVYSPHDLTPAEMRHYIGRNALGRGKPPHDAIAESGVNPPDLYKNFTLIEQWRTSAGRIKHNKETGFSPVNQRKVAKAVRRAIGLALVPSTHAHPEILARNMLPVDSLSSREQKRGSVYWEGQSSPPPGKK